MRVLEVSRIRGRVHCDSSANEAATVVPPMLSTIGAGRRVSDRKQACSAFVADKFVIQCLYSLVFMADKNVRTYQNVSNRAKARDANEHKVVYKSVLDNPFQIPW